MAEKYYLSKKSYEKIIDKAQFKKRTIFRSIFDPSNITRNELSVKIEDMNISKESSKNIMMKAGGKSEIKKERIPPMASVYIINDKDNNFLLGTIMSRYISRIGLRTREIVESYV